MGVVPNKKGFLYLINFFTFAEGVGVGIRPAPNMESWKVLLGPGREGGYCWKVRGRVSTSV